MLGAVPPNRKANRKLVAGEDGRTAGETCSLLLVALGTEPSDEAAVREYGATDRAVADSHG